MVPVAEVRLLSLSVDQALTYVISMGAVAPDEMVHASTPSASESSLPAP